MGIKTNAKTLPFSSALITTVNFVHFQTGNGSQQGSGSATGNGLSNGRWKKEDAADQNFDYMFKILIIGNSSVGKTSFLFRYADDTFTSAFVSTVGIDFKVKTVCHDGRRVKLQIWVSRTLINCSCCYGCKKKA